MGTLILTAIIVLLTLSAIAYVSDKRKSDDARSSKGPTLLPGDISWQNESGNVRVYFPVTTSIVVSIVLTLLLWLFR